MSDLSIFLIVIAMILTLGVLFFGIFSMARGGKFNQRYSQNLMRLRLLCQVIALLLFLLAVWLNAQ